MRMLFFYAGKCCKDVTTMLAGCLLGAPVPRLGRQAGPHSQHVCLWISIKVLGFEKSVSGGERCGRFLWENTVMAQSRGDEVASSGVKDLRCVGW